MNALSSSLLFKFSIVVVIVTGASSDGAFGQTNAWNGTWRLNQAKSRLGGPTFTIAVLPGGGFKITTRNISYTLICDGKYRPVGQRNLACTEGTLTTMDVAERDGGRAVNTVHREVSPDGKSLIQTISTVEEHGSGKSTQKVFTRTSKPSGLAGEWIDPKELERLPQELVTAVNGTTFHLGFPVEQQYADMKLDGAEAPIHGTYSGVRATLSVKAETGQRLLIVEKLNGAVMTNGTLILSSDGRSITEETWKPGAPKIKTRLVYEK
jgi:hypothetical protein